MDHASSVSNNMVFLFPAHGSEHASMCKDLYTHFPRFREVFDYCAEYLVNELDADLRHLVSPPRGQEEHIRSIVNQTCLVQPALFAVEYSLSCFLKDLGISPATMLGYSVGEFTAACLAGVFSLDDGLKLVTERGRLIQSLPAGSMLAVGLPENECRALENDRISLATVLEENHCVLSGVPEAIDTLNTQLRTRQVASKEIPVSHAFHSVMMDPAVDPFARLLGDISFSAPKTPFISCVTGDIAGNEILTADYWAGHLRNTIRWKDALATLAQDPHNLLVEVGPGNLLTSLARRHPLLAKTQRVFSLCTPDGSRQSAVQHFLGVLSELEHKGIAINWPALASRAPTNRSTTPTTATEENLSTGTSVNARHDEQHQSLEEVICELFAKILKLPVVKPADNFFDLGGNSLMAMRIMARLRDTYNLQISIAEIFGADTVHEIIGLLAEGNPPESNEEVRTANNEPAPDAQDSRNLNNDCPAPAPQRQADTGTAGKHTKFSLFFFSAVEDGITDNKYDLVLEAARYADEHGFHAIWTPERHFNKFGGLYASPSVLGAALASITSRIGIRAGSVISPLGHPFRIAEEWSIIDNLSGGRAGVAFGSGFQPRDFILAPDNFEQRKQIMLENIETIQHIWQGHAYPGKTPDGDRMDVFMWPRPVQSALPFWLATTRDPETFEQAGKMGAGVLTAMLRLTVPELQERIAVYRNARAAAGYDPDTGEVTLMLHTFIGPDMAFVRQQVTAPLRAYLRSHMLHTQNVSAGTLRTGAEDSLNREDEEALLDFAFERYFNEASLLGTPENCLPRLQQFAGIGVTEIGCLVDFGVAPEATLESIRWIAKLKQLSGQASPGA